jgi:hypothetical protein
MRQAALFPMIREELERLGNGYLPLPEIVPPELASPALSGALAMAAGGPFRRKSLVGKRRPLR